MVRSTSELRRIDTVGIRTLIAGGIGMLLGAVSTALVTWQAAILVGWDFAAAFLLTWTWVDIARLNGQGTKSHANREDPSRRLSEAIIIVSGVALLAAVGLLLVRAGQTHSPTRAYLIAIGILSVILSWGTVHTIFALRYTRAYYRGTEGGVDFNEEDPPAYLDFAYLSFTIGMTFQVSDTDLTTKSVRRLALGHALLSYLFGALILALSINVVAGLLG